MRSAGVSDSHYCRGPSVAIQPGARQFIRMPSLSANEASLVVIRTQKTPRQLPWDPSRLSLRNSTVCGKLFDPRRPVTVVMFPRLGINFGHAILEERESRCGHVLIVARQQRPGLVKQFK